MEKDFLQHLKIRHANRNDVPAIVRLIHGGSVQGTAQEPFPDTLPGAYYDAFSVVITTPNNHLMVVEFDDKVIATFHLTYLVNLAGMGRPDAQVESVHVAEEFRGKGVGQWMMEWVIREARNRNCRRVQLTTNKARKDAHRFYHKLGFEASHEGMKLFL